MFSKNKYIQLGQMQIEPDLIDWTNITSSSSDFREQWTSEEWLKHFEELEQYPEAAKALKLYNSKLYKALK